MEPATAAGETPDGDPAQRLHDDGPAHLGRAVYPFDERDRHLHDSQPGPYRPHRQVDLKAIPLGLHLVERDRAQRGGPVGAVTAGGVLEPDAEHQPGIRVAAA